MTAKVENLCARKRTKQIVVDAGERACINCVWYEQHYRQNRGNVAMWVPVCAGWCLRQDRPKGPLTRPCRNFAQERQ